VSACYLPFDGACHLIVITVPSDYQRRSAHQTNDAFCKAIAEFVFRTRGGAIVPRLMVVRDDIDPTSTRDVLWSMMTRCHPGRGEVNFPHLATNPRDAFLRPDEKAVMFTTKVLNCLPPESWTAETMPLRASFDFLYPADLRARILGDWKTGYGLLSPSCQKDLVGVW